MDLIPIWLQTCVLATKKKNFFFMTKFRFRKSTFLKILRFEILVRIYYRVLKSRNFQKCTFSKIKFRHEKAIFFQKIFFPDKIWLWSFDFCHLEVPVSHSALSNTGHPEKIDDFSRYLQILTFGRKVLHMVLYPRSVGVR